MGRRGVQIHPHGGKDLCHVAFEFFNILGRDLAYIQLQQLVDREIISIDVVHFSSLIQEITLIIRAKIIVQVPVIDCKIRVMDFSENLLREVTFSYIHSSGPGGQNVNKVATTVQLRFDAQHSQSLDEGARARLIKIAGKRVTENGVILIEAKRYRSQEKNREDAQKRLLALVEKAQKLPEKRIPTRPTATSKQTRFENKKHTSLKKQNRRTSADWD